MIFLFYILRFKKQNTRMISVLNGHRQARIQKRKREREIREEEKGNHLNQWTEISDNSIHHL